VLLWRCPHSASRGCGHRRDVVCRWDPEPAAAWRRRRRAHSRPVRSPLELGTFGERRCAVLVAVTLQRTSGISSRLVAIWRVIQPSSGSDGQTNTTTSGFIPTASCSRISSGVKIVPDLRYPVGPFELDTELLPPCIQRVD